MRQVILAAALLMPAAALAQVPRTGVAAPPGGAPDGVFTAAPVPAPGTSPGITGPGGGPGAIPGQVAPPGLAAGPADSTPFSSTGSGALPSDPSTSLNRDRTGGPAASTPNTTR